MLFQPFTIKYDGREITIPADKILQAIAVVEEVITFDELNRMYVTNNYKRAQLVKAFMALLNFAGDKTDAEAFYKSMYTKGEAMVAVMGTCQMLMVLMIPPPDMQSEAAPTGNQGPQKKSLSKKSIKR